MKQNISLKRESLTLVDQILEITRNRILSGKIKPGERISEAMLSKEFEVSRIPAREVLIALEKQHFVTKTHLGREVNSISYKKVKELFEVRIMLEEYSVKRAMKIATERDIKHLGRIISSMRSSLEGKQYKNFQKFGQAFHAYLFKLTKNSTLIELYELVREQIEWAAMISLKMPDRINKTFDEHVEIYNEIVKKGYAGDRMREHLEIYRDIILKKIKSDNNSIDT